MVNFSRVQFYMNLEEKSPLRNRKWPIILKYSGLTYCMLISLIGTVLEILILNSSELIIIL